MRTNSHLQQVPEPDSITTHFKVYGMKDAAASQLAFEALGRVAGIHMVRVNVDLRRIAVTHCNHPGLAEEIIGVLRNLGFRPIRKT